MAKTMEEYFHDWEKEVFGYNYGSGEIHILGALARFMLLVGAEDVNGDSANVYDFNILEKQLGPIVTWLLINVLCHAGIIDYGTSPRFGFLTTEGYVLQKFIKLHTVDELWRMCTWDLDEYFECTSID